MKKIFIKSVLLSLCLTSVQAEKWVPKYQKKLKNNNKQSSVKSLTKEKSKSTDRKTFKPASENKKLSASKKITKQELKFLEEKFKSNLTGKANVDKFKKRVIQFGSNAVPTLIKVMKSNKFPMKNRWVATFLLGRIMGKKASAFLSKYCSHPEYTMRLAALKTLLAIKETRYKGLYAKMLMDKSIIVRIQALDNIVKMDLKQLSPYVWKMLYDKSNYVQTSGKHKRGDIIKEIIKTVGLLKFKKAKKPLLEMSQRKKYKDIFKEIDFSLAKITGKASPATSNNTVKRHYWKRVLMENKTI